MGNLLGQKSFFAQNYKFLQILIHTVKTRQPIINAWYFMDDLLQAARGILNSLNYATHLSSNSDNVFSKES